VAVIALASSLSRQDTPPPLVPFWVSVHPFASGVRARAHAVSCPSGLKQHGRAMSNCKGKQAGTSHSPFRSEEQVACVAAEEADIQTVPNIKRMPIYICGSEAARVRVIASSVRRISLEIHPSSTNLPSAATSRILWSACHPHVPTMDQGERRT
jgi:hypothetical protein